MCYECMGWDSFILDLYVLGSITCTIVREAYLLAKYRVIEKDGRDLKPL